MAITNRMLFVVAFLHTHMGQFVGGGFTLAAAAGLMWESKTGHRELMGTGDEKY